eukprot:15143947-Alexandrium_andersonii.AAC.1
MYAESMHSAPARQHDEAVFADSWPPLMREHAVLSTIPVLRGCDSGFNLLGVAAVDAASHVVRV